MVILSVVIARSETTKQSMGLAQINLTALVFVGAQCMFVKFGELDATSWIASPSADGSQ